MLERLRTVRTGPAVVLCLMIAAFLVTLAIAFQGWRAARAHAAMTERALAEYAEVALWEFGRMARWDMLFNVSRRSASVLFRIGAHTAAGDLPPVERIPDAYGVILPPTIAGPIDTYVRYDVATRSVRLRGRHEADSALRDVLADRLSDWVERLLPVEPVGGLLILPPGAPADLVAFGTVTNLEQVTTHLLGIVVDSEALRPVFDRILDSIPILPPTITGGRSNRDLLSLEVVAPRRDLLLFRSDTGGPGPAATREAFAPYADDVELRLALRREGRETLAAGMPSGVQTGSLALLLGLSAGLLGAMALMLRREYELMRLRADFVAGVSHELRTPVAQIRMFAETLQMNRVRSAEERQQFEKVIVEESHRLSHLVNDVLLFASLDRRTAPPARTASHDLGTLLEEIIAGFRPLAAAQRMKVVLSSPADLRARVDPDLLRHAVLNLLDNAMKYGPDGQRILIELTEHEGMAEIAVQDEGPGVPASEAGRIWERFVRLPRDRNSHIAGAGIGLAVVRDALHRQGGTARLERTPSGGARFVLALPLCTRPDVTTLTPEAET